MNTFNLRDYNVILGDRAFAYRIMPRGYVRLRDAYDIYSALILKYNILVTQIKL